GLKAHHDQLDLFLKKAPGFIYVLRGPNHVYEFANEAYYEHVGKRDLLGRPVAAVLPELVAQGYLDKLDQVYATGRPFVGKSLPMALERTAGGTLERRYIDLICQPIHDIDGKVSGVFVQGMDVTG